MQRALTNLNLNSMYSVLISLDILLDEERAQLSLTEILVKRLKLTFFL